MWINSLLPEQITKNFNSSEIDKASHYESALGFEFDRNIVDVAQYVRDVLQVPVSINSAFRSKEYNATIENSAKNSQHIQGKALDISGSGVVAFMRKAFTEKNSHWQAMERLGLNGIGFYSNFVHIDSRADNFAFWGDYKAPIKETPTSSIIIGAVLIIGVFFMRYA